MKFGRMKAQRRNRLLLVLFLLGCVGGATTFALLALNENINLFYSPQQIVAGEAIEADDISAEEYEAMRADYRREVSEGSRQRNTHGMTSLPPELDGRIEVEFRSAPEPTPKQSEDDDWDVSDYFSRERPPEPEPDTLE